MLNSFIFFHCDIPCFSQQRIFPSERLNFSYLWKFKGKEKRMFSSEENWTSFVCTGLLHSHYREGSEVSNSISGYTGFGVSVFTYHFWRGRSALIEQPWLSFNYECPNLIPFIKIFNQLLGMTYMNFASTNFRSVKLLIWFAYYYHFLTSSVIMSFNWCFW